MSRRAGAWLGVALFVSLLANVFMGSVLVARMLLPGDDKDGGSRYSSSRAWQQMAEQLPEPHRAAAVELWQAVREQKRQKRSGWAEARQAANAALLTEPFDAEAMRNAFAMMRAASTARWTGYQEAILATAPHVPIERRRAYAEEQERRWAEREARRKADE